MHVKHVMHVEHVMHVKHVMPDMETRVRLR